MKFKVKYEKSNLIFMTSIISLCFIICIIFMILKQYLYTVIYVILTSFIIYIYYFTSYKLDERKFVIKLGFINIGFKYEHIWKVEELMKGVKITTKNLSLTVYPDEPQKFVKELNKKIDKSLNIKK